MAEGKGQRKWPIPPGFVWDHNIDRYRHPDGRVWNPDNNTIGVPVDPRQIEGGGPGVAPTSQLDNSIYSSGPMHDTSCDSSSSSSDGGGGPRILPADVEAAIKSQTFMVDGTLTICVLTLQNGFKVTGESACADPANFNQAKGEELARKAACEKIWPLLGYALRDRLHNQGI